jgi:hypothetical protein
MQKSPFSEQIQELALAFLESSSEVLSRVQLKTKVWQLANKNIWKNCLHQTNSKIKDFIQNIYFILLYYILQPKVKKCNIKELKIV